MHENEQSLMVHSTIPSTTGVRIDGVPQALNDMVLIREEKPPTETKGGIALPETTDKRGIRWGEVVSVGPGRPSEGGGYLVPTVRLGDVVGWTYGGATILIDDEKYVVQRSSDLALKR